MVPSWFGEHAPPPAVPPPTSPPPDALAGAAVRRPAARLRGAALTSSAAAAARRVDALAVLADAARAVGADGARSFGGAAAGGTRGQERGGDEGEDSTTVLHGGPFGCVVLRRNNQDRPFLDPGEPVVKNDLCAAAISRRAKEERAPEALDRASSPGRVLRRNRRKVAMLVKKYSNRRLYDTEESRYITLEELTDKVRRGADVQIVDAKSGEDLTQATLTQIILESKGARLLPTHLLARLIRMQDDALAEFFGKYMSGALELYLTAKQGAQAVAPYFPFATMPFTAGNAFARMMSGVPFAQPQALWGEPTYGVAAPPPPPPPSREPTPAPAAPGRGELDALKGELEALKREMRKKRR